MVSLDQGNTTYTMQVRTSQDGRPIATLLRSYIVAKGFNFNTTLSTGSTGIAEFNVTIPESAGGTVLDIVIAKTEGGLMSFGVLAFAHNSSTPEPNGTFTRLSPLNFNLNITFASPSWNLTRVQAYSMGYSFNATQANQTANSASYTLPRLVDRSPMVVAVTGYNDTSYFAEWTSYPQIPLIFGPDVEDSTLLSRSETSVFWVIIQGVPYKLSFTCREVR